MAGIYDGLCLLLSVSLCPHPHITTPAEESVKPSRQVETPQEFLVLRAHLRSAACLGLHTCFAFDVHPWSKTRRHLL